MDIGKAYRSNKDYQSAQIWHRKAYTYSYTCCLEELLGYKILSASALAENYLYFNQLDSAQTFIDTAFNIQERIKNYYKEAERYRIRGEIQVARGNYPAALADFRIAEKRNKTKSNPVVVHRLDKSIAEAYYGLGRIDSALFFYKKALLTPDSTVQVTIMNQLSKIYATQGQYKEALSLEKQSRLLELRLFSIEKEQVLASLTIKKDAEAQMKDAANKIRLTSLGLVTCFILLICALAISWVWVKKNKQEKALAEAREQLKALALTETQAILEQTETQLVFKDTLIKELKLQLLDIKTSSYDSNTPVTATEQLDLRQIKVLTTDDWMRFRTLFDKEYPNLTNRLKEQYPDLSPADVRLFLLTKTGFDPQEIAYIVGIALSSIYKSRHRLRRKLGLIDDDGFDSFIRTF